ncbi:MAG: hypothetical protein M0C28_41145 [Candidatus Moduliflexus flocculans]|nr:hypothetical protein [Candidatus Moduliflexus flocculans]
MRPSLERIGSGRAGSESDRASARLATAEAPASARAFALGLGRSLRLRLGLQVVLSPVVVHAHHLAGPRPAAGARQSYPAGGAGINRAN